MLSVFITLICLFTADPQLPTVTVTADDTPITTSCRIVIPPGTTIPDPAGDGAIQIAAPGITVEFAPGTTLRGAPVDTPPDQYEGCGIRLNGHAGVRLRGVRVSGYRCGIRAGGADGLVLEDIDASDNRRARLLSTPLLESGADWIHPQSNEDHRWLDQYGAALYVEQSRDVTVRDCRVRHGQNALCLDRVSDSRIYDNDFSFNSGWGIALWRSSRNIISRNACDFCIRGYSHDVYNRGQDSAGILAFEQCSDNLIAENSATHCGDGFFGFAGREALGQRPAPAGDFSYRRRGNNNNLLWGNDFSYAAAHGIEMTFSFDNRFIGNRLVDNCICGVWAGYCQDTLIASNLIADNGRRGYGLERGGVNIEFGRNNRIVGNCFSDNRCAVHLWWTRRGRPMRGPWIEANLGAPGGNEIAGNLFDSDLLLLHVRGRETVTLGNNHLFNIGRELLSDDEARVEHDDHLTLAAAPPLPQALPGRHRPTGARPNLRGRQNIIMTEWGPWDHESPLVRLVQDVGRQRLYALELMPAPPRIELSGAGVRAELEHAPSDDICVVRADTAGVLPYRLTISAGNFTDTIDGTLLATTWRVTTFPSHADPIADPNGWQAEAELATETCQLPSLHWFRHRRLPADGPPEPVPGLLELPEENYGVIARTHVPMKRGRWQITVVADDGVRVIVDSQKVIDAWERRWSPQQSTGIFELDQDRTVEIVVEHFQLTNYAALDLEIDPAPPTSSEN
jgi:parallel beta-helix repeat protein